MSARDGPPLVVLRGAAFGYRRRKVIAGIDLEVRSGDFLGIVGPNGAGKSTLFRGILGLISPLAGEVRLATSALGYVPQRDVLEEIYPLTVEEVVRLGCGRRLAWRPALPRAERRLALACLGRVGLAERRREAFAALSGGQRQRALIARALVARPELLLLDEPTSGVDRASQEQIFALLRDLNEREGLAVLLVSHQLALVRRAVREVLWVEGGKVTRGEARQLLRPERVAGLPAGEGEMREGEMED